MDTALPNGDRALGKWLRTNAWQIFVGIVLAAVAFGQYRESQTGLGAQVNDLRASVASVLLKQERERERLDPVYMPREVARAYQDDVLRQLSEIKDELRLLRAEARR